MLGVVSALSQPDVSTLPFLVRYSEDGEDTGPVS